MNKSLVSIRLATVDDWSHLPGIENVAAERFRTTEYAWLADAEPLSIRDIQHYFGIGQIWVAVNAAQKMIGFAIAYPTGKTVYLREIDVLPDYGSQGIGSGLLKTVCDWALAQQYNSVWLSTFSDVPWNAPFYRKLGFKVIPSSQWDAAMLKVRESEAHAKWPIERRVIMQRPCG